MQMLKKITVMTTVCCEIYEVFYLLQTAVHIIATEYNECRETEAVAGSSPHWRQGL